MVASVLSTVSKYTYLCKGHKKNKHKKCCMKLFLNFQSITASNESISINTEHIGDENSTRRTS